MITISTRIINTLKKEGYTNVTLDDSGFTADQMPFASNYLEYNGFDSINDVFNYYIFNNLGNDKLLNFNQDIFDSIEKSHKQFKMAKESAILEEELDLIEQAV